MLFVALLLIVVAIVLHLFSPWQDIARLVGGVGIVVLIIWAILALTNGGNDVNTAAVVAGPLLLAPLPRYRRQFTIR